MPENSNGSERHAMSLGSSITEKIMKLTLLFIVIDLFTLLAYPFVFMRAKLRQFSKARNKLVTGPSHGTHDLLVTIDTRKKGDYAYSKD